MRDNTKRNDLQKRATKLEDAAIAIAEGGSHYSTSHPNQGKTIIAHAELKLKAAVLLRKRAQEFV